MRITNRVHIPWAIFVLLASTAATVLYLANFHPARLPFTVPLPRFFGETPPSHRTVGGTPLGLIFGSISFGVFIFAALLGVRKKIVLWRIGTIQRWLRAHIWLTILTVPLILLHAGFRLGGPMTTLLMVLYAFVMISGFYGLALQHHIPRLMKERLPAETVFEQIPHIRAQLCLAAGKMRDSFKPAPPKTENPAAAATVVKAAPPAKPAAGATTAMTAKDAEVTTPSARAKSTTGSPVTAAPIAETAAVALNVEAGGTGKKEIASESSVAGVADPGMVAPSATQKPGVSDAVHSAPPRAVVSADDGPKPKSEFEVATGVVASTRTEPTETAAGAEAMTDASGSPRTAAAPDRAEGSAANAPARATKPAETISPPSASQTTAPAASAATPEVSGATSAASPATPAKPAPAAAKPTPAAPAKPTATASKPAAAPAAKPAAKAPALPTDPASEAMLAEFIELEILPYLSAKRGEKLRLGNPRYSEDTFRLVKLRVAEAYRSRVEEIQAWCDERRMLDLQTRLQHWLHGWLFIHVPFSFLLLMLTAWHALVTLFYYQ